MRRRQSVRSATASQISWIGDQRARVRHGRRHDRQCARGELLQRRPAGPLAPRRGWPAHLARFRAVHAVRHARHQRHAPLPGQVLQGHGPVACGRCADPARRFGSLPRAATNVVTSGIDQLLSGPWGLAAHARRHPDPCELGAEVRGGVPLQCRVLWIRHELAERQGCAVLAPFGRLELKLRGRQSVRHLHARRLRRRRRLARTRFVHHVVATPLHQPIAIPSHPSHPNPMPLNQAPARRRHTHPSRRSSRQSSSRPCR